MNEATTRIDPVTRTVGRIIWPDSVDESRDALHRTRDIAIAATALITAVQIIVWVAIGVATDGLDSPWWLWSTVPGIVIATGLTWLIGARDRLGVQPADR